MHKMNKCASPAVASVLSLVVASCCATQDPAGALTLPAWTQESHPPRSLNIQSPTLRTLLLSSSDSLSCACNCCSWPSGHDAAASNASCHSVMHAGVRAVESCAACNPHLCALEYEECSVHESHGGRYGAGGQTSARCYRSLKPFTPLPGHEPSAASRIGLLLVPVVILLVCLPAIMRELCDGSLVSRCWVGCSAAIARLACVSGASPSDDRVEAPGDSGQYVAMEAKGVQRSYTYAESKR